MEDVQRGVIWWGARGSEFSGYNGRDVLTIVWWKGDPEWAAWCHRSSRAVKVELPEELRNDPERALRYIETLYRMNHS